MIRETSVREELRTASGGRSAAPDGTRLIMDTTLERTRYASLSRLRSSDQLLWGTV